MTSAEEVSRRLAKHPKLARTLLASQRPAWMRDESGLYRPSAVFDFDRRQLEGLLDFIGRGLAWHHWKLCLGPDDASGSMVLTDTGNAFLQGWLSHYTAAHRVEQSLGNGTIRYGGIQATNPPQLTVWGISMFGGLVLSGSERRFDGSAEPSTMWWVITGPPEMRDLFTQFKQSL